MGIEEKAASPSIGALPDSDHLNRELSVIYSDLIENVRDVVWSVQLTADLLDSPASYVSPQSWPVLGYQPEAFLNRKDLWSSRIHPDDLGVLSETTKQLFQGEDNQTRIYRFRHGQTGEFVWLEDRVTVQRDKYGERVSLFGIARDITQRKRYEERERQRALVLERIAKGRPLSELLDLIVRMIEAESSSTYCSVLLMDSSGTRLHIAAAPRFPEFYNSAIDGIVIGPDVGSCGASAATGRRVVVENISTHPNWSLFRDVAEQAGFRSCWSEPILSTIGSVLGTFAIYHDTHRSPTAHELDSIASAANLASIAIERVRSMETLRESEERFRVIFEQASVGVSQVDVRTGHFIRVNQRYCRILDRPETEIIGQHVLAVTHPEDREISRLHLEKMIKGEIREYSLEKRYLRPDGSERWVKLNVSALWKETEPPTINLAIAEDITDRKIADSDRRRLDAQLQHAQKLESLGIMAGGIAHDFNNLLTGILGYCDLARMEMPPHSQASDHLTEAVSGARQAADLTKQLLAYSGKGKFVIEQIVLSALIEDMTRLLQISISKKSVLRFSFLPDLPMIDGDATQLRQIVMNLVINASEAIGDRSGLIAVSTGVIHCDREYLNTTLDDQGLPEGMYAFIEVADTGCGMNEETRRKIFDPFFTTKFTGRGLGLSAVIGIVRSHRGTIKCYSEPGKGTTFKVLFPVSEHQIRETITPTTQTDHWRGSGTILVVDDEESILALARHMLVAMGFQVLTAENGRIGVDVFRAAKEPIRLVILDMTMPHWDGEETFRELRRIQPDVRAILTSGYSEQAATGRFAGKGLAGFIQKPYRFEDLKAIIRKVLDVKN